MLGFLSLANGVRAQRRRRDRDKRRAEKYFDKYAKCVKKKGKKDKSCLKYRQKAQKYLAKADAHDAKIRGKSGTSIHVKSTSISSKGQIESDRMKKELARTLVKEKVDSKTIIEETGIDVTDPDSDIYIKNYDEMVEEDVAYPDDAEESFESEGGLSLTSPAVIAIGAIGILGAGVILLRKKKTD
jgi:hypothetical protein